MTPVFGLIVIGDEILSGKRTENHLAKINEILGERGLTLSWAEYVGDDAPRITAVLRRAFDSGDVVFCTGGISAAHSLRPSACLMRRLQGSGLARAARCAKARACGVISMSLRAPTISIASTWECSPRALPSFRIRTTRFRALPARGG